MTRGLIESQYEPASFENGKYAQETREKAGEVGRDWKKGVFERGLVDTAQALIMPEVYEGLSESLGEGLKKFGAKFKGAGKPTDVARSVGRGSPHINTTDLVDPTKVFPTGGQAAMLPQNLGAVSQAATEGLGAYTGTAAQNLSMARELGLDLSGGQTVMGAYQDAGYGLSLIHI